VVTPGVKQDEPDEEVRKKSALDGAAATQYRATAARANYLALDRPDMAFAVKELTRSMANPTTYDVTNLKRLARYLKGAPRAVMTYEWQERPQDLDGYADSDWAGCRRTRKSTSGGVITRGAHPIKWWSKTQPVIALSSGEAELYGTVKVSTETLGAAAAMRDLGEEHGGRIWVDASAALGIIQRKGLGKVRHIETHYLWVQETAARRKLLYQKVPGTENCADLLTKHVEQTIMSKHCRSLRMTFPRGQSSIALQMNHLHEEDGWRSVGDE